MTGPGASAQPLRIGILGASRIAENAIVGPAQALGHRLVAVAARDRSRAEAFASKYGVERVLDSYDEVIDDPEVEVVYNPLANALHGPWNLAAIRAGKPVLSEKPFARNEFEAREIAGAATAGGVTVLEGFHYLFHPLMTRTLELLDGDAIGAVGNVEVIMAMPEPGPDDPRWSYSLAGGAMMDLGCYALHVFRVLGRYCGGAPEIESARAVVRGDRIDESCATVVRYPNGATGTQVSSMVAGEYVFTVRIDGADGSIILHDYLGPNRDGRLTVLAPTRGTATVENVDPTSTYTFQLAAFAAAVRGGPALPIGVDDAVANMAFIDAAYRAAGLPPR